MKINRATALYYFFTVLTHNYLCICNLNSFNLNSICTSTLSKETGGRIFTNDSILRRCEVIYICFIFQIQIIIKVQADCVFEFIFISLRIPHVV